MEWLLLRITIILLSTSGGVGLDSSTSWSPSTSVPSIAKLKRVGVIVSQGFELLDALGPYEALKEVQEHYYSKVDIEHRRWKNDADSGIQCNNNSNNNNNSGDRTTLEVEVYLASFETNSVRSSSGVTVCTGASYAALLGLLDGATATTNSLFLDRFRMDYPTVTWMSLADNTNRRFVRSTNSIVTTAGITAGIDGILDAIQKWCGWEVAEATRQCLEWPLSIETNQHKLKHKPAAVTTS